MQQELWRRMAFNAICGNGDDHPRNHGIVHDQGHWRLSKAFDIAPYITYSGTQAMAITRDGTTIASKANLLKDCASFGMPRDEAQNFLEQAIDQLPALWAGFAQAAGGPKGDAPLPLTHWLE